MGLCFKAREKEEEKSLILGFSIGTSLFFQSMVGPCIFMFYIPRLPVGSTVKG